MKTMNENNEQGNFNGIDSLVAKLKEKDDRKKKDYRSFSIIMIVLVFFYAALLIVNPDPDLTLKTRLSGTCYVISFLIGAYLFRKEYRKMSNIDYSEPLLAVLKQATKRLSPNKKSFFAFLFVPLFVDLGLSLSGGPARYMPVDWSAEKKLLILQLVFWGIMIIAATIGYIVSSLKTRPNREALNEMIRELEGSGELVGEI